MEDSWQLLGVAAARVLTRLGGGSGRGAEPCSFELKKDVGAQPERSGEAISDDAAEPQLAGRMEEVVREQGAIAQRVAFHARSELAQGPAAGGHFGLDDVSQMRGSEAL